MTHPLALGWLAVLLAGACAAPRAAEPSAPGPALDAPRRAPQKGGPFDFAAARPQAAADGGYASDLSHPNRYLGADGLRTGSGTSRPFDFPAGSR
jgi:hypothetical protein